VPDPVRPVPEYREAVETGTRTEAGHPGEEYWQQWSEYRIRARLEPEDRTLEGRTRIDYHNRSPDTLRTLHLHLHQNLHAEGAMRNEPQEVTGGVRLDRVAVDGVELLEGAEERPAFDVRATILRLEAPEPVAPGETVQVDVDWAFRIPQSGAGRMGWSDDDLFYLGYWYPQMAVYDDVVGWQTDPYLGRGEFYMGYGRYDVRLEVPEGWVVRATGRLQNPGAVFPDRIRERLARAGESDSVVHVLTREDFGPGSATRDAEDGWLTWHFAAENVRDFAFSATRGSLWDAARSPVGDRDGDGETDYTRVEALYRPEAGRWSEVWRYSQHSIDFLSRFTGHPYPWPHMTAVEGGGIIGGGMEYPMMTIMGDYEARGDSALYYVTAHELAHMWLPMLVGTDEKRYAWMDEGTITFLENQARKEFFPGRDHDVPDRRDYVRMARRGDEVPVMTWMDYQYPMAGNVPNYDKPGTMLVALRHVLGDGTFREALTTFVNEWAYRHPYPWDLFRTFERVSGRDLGWFWRSWYLETWTLDHAVAAVEQGDGTATIRIEDQGWGVMPVPVAITLEDGTILERTVPVDPWLEGRTTAEITVDVSSPVTRVEIDREGDLPDVDRADNVWTATDAPSPRAAGGSR
jgi:aminopeptidase N